MTRRQFFENGKWIGSLLVIGFVSDIPWRVIDSFKKRQATPKRQRVRLAGVAVALASSSVGSLTIRKKVPARFL